jgi:gliding motility-associated-like protein
MPDLDDLVICDINYDGQAYFNLSQQNAAILAANTIAASQLQIRYYTNATSAMNGTNGITVPNNYLSQLPAPQTIWVVVTDMVTGCKATGTFDLIVNLPIDVRNQNNKLTLCDDVLPNDQFTSFDLTVMNAQITLNTAGATLTYYPSVTDMNNGTNAIANPTAYTNVLPAVQTLGVLVTTAAGCTSKTTLTIRVEPLPTPKTDPVTLETCDIDQTIIGTELFDVTVNQTYIQDGYPNLTFEYYASMNDLNNGIQIPDATMYQGGNANATPPSNIVYIKVMNNRVDSFGENCYQIVEQELIVNPLPVVADTTFVLCDDDTDGMATFTLSDFNETLLGTTQALTDFTVSYYDTQANAQAGTLVGLLPDTYIGTNLEMIYPLVIHNTTGCRNALATVTLSVKLKAIANPISQTTLNLFSVCDYDGTNDGYTSFNLTVVETELLGTQTSPPISVSYHLTQADQTTGSNPIVNPASYTNTTAFSQTIYIRVERANDAINDTSARCYDVSQITLNVERLVEPLVSSVTGNETICVDKLTGLVNPDSYLTLDSGVAAGTGYTYQWSLDGTAIVGATNAIYVVNTDAPGIYTVVLTSTSVLGCVSDISNEFEVIRSGPAVSATYTVSNAFEDVQDIQVTNDGYGVYHYQLDDGPILDNGGLFLDVSPGIHTIYIYDVKTNNPCDVVVIDNVSAINYPHYFTPNGDGIHDYWNIIGLENQPNAKIYIFDRYGKLIKQISPAGLGWNGTYNGQQLSSTDYWFTVEYFEGLEQKQFKAHFTLKR